MFRSPVAGLLAALVIIALALGAALVGALGVALIGLLLSHWFEFTQWQGSLLALGTLVVVALLVYRVLAPSQYGEPEWVDFDYDEDQEPEPPEEPPIVPWRRQRPTQGEPPVPPDHTKRK